MGLFPGPVCRTRVLVCTCKRRGQCANVGSSNGRCHLASRAARKHMGVLSPACVCFHLICGSGSVHITVESADSTETVYSLSVLETFFHSKTIGLLKNRFFVNWQIVSFVLTKESVFFAKLIGRILNKEMIQVTFYIL